MSNPGWAVRPALCAGLLVLAACSSGGGSSSVMNTTTGTGTSSPAPTPLISIAAPAAASLNGNTALIASGSTPNFTTSLPPIGTAFPISQSVLSLNATSVAAFTPTGGATATFQGTKAINGTTEGIFELKVP